MSTRAHRHPSGVKIVVIFALVTISISVSLAVFSTEVRQADTIYAPNFSFTEFQSLPANATKENVVQRLGEPLSKTLGYGGLPYSEVWNYSIPGRLLGPFSDLFGGNYYQVLFDKDGKVFSVVHNVF